jgi:hypothetical protein
MTLSITIYNYEDTLNESKRDIKLINSSYALSMEKQLKSVMGT